MAIQGRRNAVFFWVFLVALLSQNLLLLPVTSTSSLLPLFQDQKNYYPPDPHSSPSSPTTPSHGTPTPSQGSGGSCPTPPSQGGGGGSYHSPPSSTPVIIPPPTPSSPSTPPYVTDPNTPSTPPYIPDPNIPPFIIGTCNYWRSHPNLIWGLFGFWGTLGSIFGVAAATPAFAPNLSLLEALSNTRSDGLGSLYREGTASLLNSMVSKRFPFSTQQVKLKFSASLLSDKAATTQARLFKLANEGKLKA